MGGIGGVGVAVFVAVGGWILVSYWDQLADWLKVVLLMVWGVLALFGGIIALGIDTDRDRKP